MILGYSYPIQASAPPPYTPQAMPPQPQVYGQPSIPYQPQAPPQVCLSLPNLL